MAVPAKKAPDSLLDPFTLLEEERDSRVGISNKISSIQKQMEAELQEMEGKILDADEARTVKLRMENLKSQLSAQQAQLNALLPAKSIQLVLDSVALKMEALLKMQSGTAVMIEGELVEGKKKVGRPKLTPQEKHERAVARQKEKARQELEAAEAEMGDE